MEEGICGGSPIIKSTRIPVWAIVGYYKKLNYSVEEILEQMPMKNIGKGKYRGENPALIGRGCTTKVSCNFKG